MASHILVCLKAVAVSAFLLLSAVRIGHAATIVVGNHVILPNTPGQVVELNIVGTEMIAGLDLFMTVNGGLDPAPVVTVIDITGPGTIFHGNNTGLSLLGTPTDPPSVQPAAVTTAASGRVLANGLLARVTFDTTGIPAGVYSWSLTNHPYRPTDLGIDENFDFIYPMIVDGTLSVPEPTSFALGALACLTLGVGCFRIRAHHRRQRVRVSASS